MNPDKTTDCANLQLIWFVCLRIMKKIINNLMRSWRSVYENYSIIQLCNYPYLECIFWGYICYIVCYIFFSFWYLTIISGHFKSRQLLPCFFLFYVYVFSLFCILINFSLWISWFNHFHRKLKLYRNEDFIFTF